MSLSITGEYKSLGENAKMQLTAENIIPPGMAEEIIVRAELSRSAASHLSERSISSAGSSTSFSCPSGRCSPPEECSPEYVSLSDDFKEKVLNESFDTVRKNLGREMMEYIEARFVKNSIPSYRERVNLEKELEAAFKSGVFLEDLMCGLEFEIELRVRRLGSMDEAQVECYFDQIQDFITSEEKLDFADKYYEFSKAHVLKVSSERANKSMRHKIYKASSRAL